MKRTFSANIDGQIFHIDEDAFNLLNNYLEQLRQTFHGNEGSEIVGDIESRIRELFSERIGAGARVIVISDVNNVIETMGRPEDLCEEPAANGTSTPPPVNDDDQHKPFITFTLPGRKRLYRNLRNKVLGGVFGGLAAYLGWNANIMRILYLALALCTYFWPLTIIYLIAWMIIPAATTPRQILEMTGEPVNVNTVGQTVLASSPIIGNQNQGDADGSFFVTVLTAIGKTFLVLAGLLTGIVAFGCLCGLFCIIAGTVSYSIFDSTQILSHFDMFPLSLGWSTTWATIWATASLLLGIVLIFGLMAYGAFAEVFNTRGASKAAVITTVILSVMLFATAAILFIFAA